MSEPFNKGPEVAHPARKKDYQDLLAEEVLRSYAFHPAIKTAPTRIRPITEQDVTQMGSSFFDLEQRPQPVAVGRYLCVGVEGERWTCSEESFQERIPISEADPQGFRLFVMRAPKPVMAAVLTEPFRLHARGDVWESQNDGGVITWNGAQGDDARLRVITLAIFQRTYQFLSRQ